MNEVEKQTLEKLVDLGFEKIKIIGQTGDRVLYSHTNGDPVMDGPVAFVDGDQVRLEPWMEHLK